MFNSGSDGMCVRTDNNPVIIEKSGEQPLFQQMAREQCSRAILLFTLNSKPFS